MNRSTTPKRSVRRRRLVRGAFLILAVCVVLFAAGAHPFLATTERVDADILVVEGWIYDYMLSEAAVEFERGGYTLLATSGLEFEAKEADGTRGSYAARAAEKLVALGVPADRILSCPTPFATWARTSKSAHAVRAALEDRGLPIRGINVVSAGPHARESWVAYQHAFGRQMPVGIISVPKNSYNARYWWLSKTGLIWVPKDFLGWLKEVILGRYRSEN